MTTSDASKGPDTRAGTILGNRYRLLDKIGDGASAEVYRAHDENLDRPVAVKLLRAQLLAEPATRSRFTAEARAVARLANPHIVQVYDFGEGPDGSMFIAMQYVEGETLKEILQRRGRLAPHEAIDFARQMCLALSAAHAEGLVHRDVKPQNMLVRRDGALCLADFGIAKALGKDSNLTQAGMTFGTAAYMSPEQAVGDAVSPASDIYALGCVLYEMLSGAPPFTGDSAFSIAHKQVWEHPRPLRDAMAELPAGLEPVVVRCLEKDPARRYASATELAKQLGAVAAPAVAGTDPPARPGSPDSGAAHASTDRAASRSGWGPSPSAPSRSREPYQHLLVGQQGPLSMSVSSSTPVSTPPAASPSPGYAPVRTLRRGGGMPLNAPNFQRAPRLYPELPRGEVEVWAPPPAPPQPSMSMLPVLLPALFAVASLVITLVMAVNNPMAWLTLLSFGFMLVSSATALTTYFSQRSGYRRKVSEREGRYRALLSERRQVLQGARDQQITALEQTQPDPRECFMRVERVDRRLWERSYHDNDYLSVRIGTGAQPLSVAIKAPQPQPTADPDPLLQEAQSLAAEFSLVGGTPISLPLRDAGASGIVGKRPDVLNVARAMAMQIATHHSPDEVKMVALFPADEAPQWAWMRWLPHTWADDRERRYLACEKGAAHDLLQGLYEILNRRRLQATQVPGGGSDASTKAPPPLPHFVFFLADPSLLENEPILYMLLTQGSLVGAYVVVLAGRIEVLPKGCQAIVELGSGYTQLIQNVPAPARAALTPDEASLDLAERLARHMAPIRLQRVALPTEIPGNVPLLDVLGAATVEGLDVPSKWRANEPYKSLAVPVGRRAGAQPQLLDLHERGHGPHGLVAGTTGSGKSELLQALIASLAVNYHPHEVVFVLIDYKGGGMANIFADLPHLVGTITNLQGGLATRALAAIKSELHRRQTVLAQAGENHIDAYQQRYRRGDVTQPLPHLVIIADEFAELATEQPDFMKELISAVRVGRSLGVHLILATQKPAGVVNEQIWGNARFRISLRVERPEDSMEVLKRPDAANLTQPGRAYLQVGNNELFELFQAAYGGAPYSTSPSSAAVSTPGGRDEIMVVALDGSRHALFPLAQGATSSSSAGGTQLQAVVEHLRSVAATQGLQRLGGPWLPPLPAEVSLEQVRPGAGWDGKTWQPTHGWMEPVVGLLDDPVHQYQGPLVANLGKEGHLAVYGAPGTGKTVFLQTLITSLALTHSPEEVHMYLLDFGGRLLSAFAPLPHVGAVVLTDESERLDRLLRFLVAEMDARKERLASVGANTLPSYRAATGDKVPAILVALDNYSGFASTYPDWEDTLAQIAREGGNLGVHLVITATSLSAVRSRVSGNISLAMALPLADKGEYGSVVGRLLGVDVPQLPGRGLVKANPPLEFQTALPVDAPTDAERMARLRELMSEMAKAWQGPRPRSVRVLPPVVPLCDVIAPGEADARNAATGAFAVPIALDVDTLDPVEVDLDEGPHFLVAGGVQSGKSTALQTWALALASRFPPDRVHLYIVAFRPGGLEPLARLPHVRAYVRNDEELTAGLAEISQALRERQTALESARKAADKPGAFDSTAFVAHFPAILVLMDDYDVVRDQAQMDSRDRLEQMIRRERGLGLHVILAGQSSDLSAGWEGLIKAVKESQAGIVLGNDQSDTQVLNLRLPFTEANKSLPPGQGYYARRGRYRKVKVATSGAGTTQTREWIERITESARHGSV